MSLSPSPPGPPPVPSLLLPVKDTDADRHLVVVASGPGVWGLGQEALADAIRARFRKEDGHIVLHSGCCRSVGWLFDGIDAAGLRMYRDVVQLLRMAEVAGKPVHRLSFVCHGVGGLVARFALGELSRHDGLLLGCDGSLGDALCCFVTTDTPHLGAYPERAAAAPAPVSSTTSTSLLSSLLPASLTPASSTVAAAAMPGRTGAQVRGSDAGVGLVLGTLADPTLPYLRALRGFRRRVCLSTGDGFAPMSSTSLSSTGAATAPHSAPSDTLPFGLLYCDAAAAQFASLAVPPMAASAPLSPLRPRAPFPTLEVYELPSETPVRRAVGPRCVRGACDEEVVCGEGARGGEATDVLIEGCERAEVSLLRRAAGVTCVTLDGLSDCVVYLPPASESVRVTNATGTTVYAAAPQFSAKNCRDLTVHLYCCQPPLLEQSHGVELRPYNLAYPALAEQWAAAGIPPARRNAFAAPADLSRDDATLPAPHCLVQEAPERDAKGRLVFCTRGYAEPGGKAAQAAAAAIPAALLPAGDSVEGAAGAGNLTLRALPPYPYSVRERRRHRLCRSVGGGGGGLIGGTEEDEDPAPLSPPRGTLAPATPRSPPSRWQISGGGGVGGGSAGVDPLLSPRGGSAASASYSPLPSSQALPAAAATTAAALTESSPPGVRARSALRMFEGALSPLRHRAARRCRDGVQADCWVADCVGQDVQRLHPRVDGGVLGVRGCDACRVFVGDWSTSALVESTKDSSLMLGVCAEATVLVGLTNCVVFVCTPRLRLSGCTNVAVHAWVTQPIIIEACADVLVGPWTLALPRLPELFTKAKLNAAVPNAWHQIECVGGSTYALRSPVPTAVTEVVVEGESAEPAVPAPLAAAVEMTTRFDAVQDAQARRRLNKALLYASSMPWERRTVAGDAETHSAVLAALECAL